MSNEETWTEKEVKDLLNKYDIPTTSYKLVQSRENLLDFEFGYPVALKVCSREILHKSDAGGVILGLKNEAELTSAFEEMRKRFPNKNMLVDKMAEKGNEIIAGLTVVPPFGLTIMVGVGGVFTELYEDVSYRVLPISRYDAGEMINDLKGRKLFKSFRGKKADRGGVIDLLNKLSKIGSDFESRAPSLDLNPIFLYDDGLCVVDAKLILKKPTTGDKSDQKN